MAQITVSAGTISAPMLVPPSALVTVTPDAGAYTVIEYSTDNAAAVANGVATWYRRARGDALAASVYHVSDPAFLRFTPIGGGTAINLDLNPSASAMSGYHSARSANGSNKILPGGQAIMELPEGQALTVTGAAGTVGTLVRTDAAGTVQPAVTIGASSFTTPAYPGTQKFLISCAAGGVDVSVGAAVLGVKQDATAPYGLFICCGDSRTRYGSPGREPGIFDGRTKYLTTGGISGSWMPDIIMDGSAPLNATGNLASDATGRVRWTLAGDTAGPWTDVSQGGWFYLPSGTLANAGLFVSVLASVAPVLNGSATCTAGGYPFSWDYDLRGHSTWIAGALGGRFRDYQGYAIGGCKTSDVVKFMPQMFKSPVDSMYLQVGVNDIPNTGATTVQRDALIANLKTIIDYCAARVRRLYVGEIFAAAVKDATGTKYLAQADTAIRDYCRTKKGVRSVQANNRLVTYTTTNVVSRTGMYGDDLHFAPLGASTAPDSLIEAVKEDSPFAGLRRAPLDTWDATLQTGVINPNPTFVGSGGGTAAGVSGIVPAQWEFARSGTTQTVVGANVAATDGGPDWYEVAFANAAANDYHVLRVPGGVALPTGIANGDYMQLYGDIRVGETTGNGLALFTVFVDNVSTTNNITLLQLQPGNNVTNFGAEYRPLELFSEPQKWLDVSANVRPQIRIGGAVGGTGKVRMRNMRLEKVPGPINP